MSAKVLAFRHVPCEHLGLIADTLASHGIVCEYADLYHGGCGPDIRAADALIFMGGPMSANDDLPHIRRELELIGEAVSLGKPILGTPHTVKSFNQDSLRSFYNGVYAPANVVVTAAGNLTHERMTALVREHFESLPPGAPAPADRVPSTHARISLRNKKELEQVHLCLGVPSYPLPHEQRFVCYVLNTLLGGGMSSRLFQNIRERQGLAYAVF